ncbi:hypothetical protein [Candidatus Hecatella orcuttiae]|uniref:hypothetical protein n=1 Tax=Candidatus Hecatella orcuttiae TaxID=1935119 RepID=UPI002867E851|nr:hypothetical protein [Candidatus Hecatella orcuttiae]
MSCSGEALKNLIRNYGKTYAEELGINLKAAEESEVFKWFLASVLFGAPIAETSAKKTFRQFERSHLTAPEKILKAGWNRLVALLDEGGYTRYDFKTATKLLEAAENLKKNYGGSLNRLHDKAADSRDLAVKLQGLAKGIGPTTVNIFLREMMSLWKKAYAPLQPAEIAAAQALGLTRLEGKGEEEKRAILEDLVKAWRQLGGKMEDIPSLRAALFRFGKAVLKGKGK